MDGTFPMTPEGLMLFSAVVGAWGAFVGWAFAHYLMSKEQQMTLKKHRELLEVMAEPEAADVFIDYAKQYGLLDDKAWWQLSTPKKKGEK